jgi:DNA recombination protein RmuC
MTPDALAYALLAAVIIVIALLIVLVRRRPDALLEAHRVALEQVLRAEQREGRGELRQQLDGLALQQQQRIEAFGARLEQLRESLNDDARKARAEHTQALRDFAAALDQRVGELTRNNEQRLGEMRATLEAKLRELQVDNAAKLEQMRATVDEKLQSTLETRLGESFRLVSERLEHVQRGLGEMQHLATGVGDLKRVLGNVKSRGVFGEVQLAGLLEQVFAPDQYAANVATVPGRNERVEFAVRFPGTDGDSPVWLPIDAKFPREDYERLLDAQENADLEAARSAGDALERRVRQEAQRICDKYVAAPYTTEFAILFLPTEGLYAEVLRRPGLVESLQRDCRIAVAGPTTLLALMTSFQMGFRTLAIQKRSSEVWRTLSAVKSEFGKFGEVLDGVQKKLAEASNKIEQTGVRTRAIQRQLREVELLPEDAAPSLLDVKIDED